jgi:moderate conductance mechanosensitive channel
MSDVLSWFRGLDPETKALAIQTLRVLVILVVAWVLLALARRLIRIFRLYMARHTAPDQVNRVATLARVLSNVAGVVITIVAGTLILGELGISVAPILATAGVAGVAIGFGAQSLIKDYFNGFFLLLDDQVREGDVVEVGGKGGVVEEVTLRYVRLRDLNSHVHFIPNGEITLVTNRTRGYATPLIDIGIAYREDPDEALEVMRQVASAMREEPKWNERLVEDLEVIGVNEWADSAIILRARLKVVPPIDQWSVKREYLKRLKKAFDEHGIEIPFPHLTVYPGQLKDGTAPPLYILSDRKQTP